MERREVVKKSSNYEDFFNKNNSSKKGDWLEKGMKGVFLFSSTIAVIGIFFICLFIFAEGLPFIAKIGIKDFIFNTNWSPTNSTPSYGILPMILGSIYVTLGAMIIGVPLGLATSIYMVYYAPKSWIPFLEAAVNLLASIPSIVYGFFTLTVVVPFFRDLFGGTGMSLFTASVLLGIMILPTIISLSQRALEDVPKGFLDGSYGLGASKERTILHVAVPAASSGILASVILGIGRAMGETMAVILVAGNQARIPRSIFDGLRTLTTNIVMEMSYAAGDHRQALIATGAVLFIFILIINTVFRAVSKKVKQ